MKLSLVLSAALALSLGASVVSADDPGKPDGRPAKAAKGRVLVFGNGAARFQVERDPSAGRMTFRLADPSIRLESAPVILVNTDSGPREVTLVAAEGQPGVWVWSHDAVRSDRFDGTMRIVVAGTTYTAPLATVWAVEPAGGVTVEPTSLTERVVIKPRYGGRVLTFPDCGSSVEVVQDPATGTLTVYSIEDVVIVDAPVITITETKTPTSIILARVEGKPGVWMTKNEVFKTVTTSARIRLLVNGKPCETALVYGPSHGGQIVTVSGGPRFEVVSDPQAGSYTFYALDETYDGKTYTIENPTVVASGRTYTLTRVEDEPRAWRLVGFDAGGTDSRNAQLNFTLFGKTLSTRLGLSGIGIGVK